jgi:hypothetical protein
MTRRWLQRAATAEELAEARNQKTSRKRSAENKVQIAFNRCPYQIDTTKQSFKDALRKGARRPNECLINTIYDNFQDKLLRPDKTRNFITRETILEVLWRAEADIKDGLMTEEVSPSSKSTS